MRQRLGTGGGHSDDRDVPSSSGFSMGKKTSHKMGLRRVLSFDSFKNISGGDYTTQRLERRTSGMLFEKKLNAEAKFTAHEETQVKPKFILLAVAPFFCLVFFLPANVVLGFGGFMAVYTTILLAYIVAEFSMKPLWYSPSKPGEPLSQHMMPDYWQGIFHDPQSDLNLPFDEVEFASGRPGVTLRGWWVPARGQVRAKTVAIFVHGGGRDRRAWLRHIPFFHDMGYPCLLFDMSEHGQSDGNVRGFSYGVREQHDVMGAVTFVKDRKKMERVLVLGTSVGASSTILAASKDTRIDAVIAENPLARPEELVVHHMDRFFHHYLTPRWHKNIIMRLLYRVVVFVFLYRIGGLFKTVGAVDVVNRISPRPILISHGTADEIIPVEHSRRIFSAAAEPKTLWVSQDAWLVLLFLYLILYIIYSIEEFKRQVTAFLKAANM